MRTQADIDADLAHYTAAARRLPQAHPDHAVLHAIIDDLLTERERLTLVRA